MKDVLLFLWRKPGLRRAGGMLLLALVGWVDYVTGPEIALAPFYLIVLAGLAYFERWPVCIAFGGVAAGIYLGADLLNNPSGAHLIYPYWRAFSRFLSFAGIGSLLSLVLQEHQRLRESKDALCERNQELERLNRELQEALQELKQLQRTLVAVERKAAVSDAIYAATYQMERPLTSLSIYADELSRCGPLSEEAGAFLEKLRERILDMERALEAVRHIRKHIVEGPTSLQAPNQPPQ